MILGVALSATPVFINEYFEKITRIDKFPLDKLVAI